MAHRKKGNEGRQKEKRLAHPAKPVEMETKQWWGAELGWASAGWGAEVRTDKRLAHAGKLLEMERKQEEKRGNEGGQKEKRLAHPGKQMERRQEEKRGNEGGQKEKRLAHPAKPVEMETKQWWGAELGWASAGWGAEVRTDKRLAHAGKLLEMERKQEEKRGNEGGQKEKRLRRQEEKRGNEGGQKEKRLAHPAQPVEMETKQWWGAELGRARARRMLKIPMSGQLGKAFHRVW